MKLRLIAAGINKFSTKCIEKCTDCKQTEYAECRVYAFSSVLQDRNPLVNIDTTKLLELKVKTNS